MKNLIVIPTEKELSYFVKKCQEIGINFKKQNVENHELIKFPQLKTGVVVGGLGKVQFGIQTQYFIDKIEGLNAILCAGASGGLKKEIVPGDIVVATETIEHDIRKFSRPLMPKFPSDKSILEQFKSLIPKKRKFSIHFGSIASGDEDVMSDERKKKLKSQTGAIAVAWEGAGGARASLFNNVPFVEVRAISDSANHKAQEDFFANLETAMGNLAELIIDWVRNKETGKL